jgi:hypothetical protein
MHPQAPWIHQAVDATKYAIDKILRQVMGYTVQENSQGFDAGSSRRYAMPARNKTEALSQIAEEGAASRQQSAQMADPAVQLRQPKPMNWREQLEQRQRLSEQPKEVPRDQPKRDDNGKVQWLL